MKTTITINQSAAFLPALTLVWFTWSAADARIIFVNPEGDDTTGNTWSEAFTYPALAVQAATGGDVIWVKTGNYYGSLIFKPRVEIYGGFAGTEATGEFSQRNWGRHPVIMRAPSGVRMANESRFDGILLQDGLSFEDGGGITCSGLNTIANCRITGNRANDRGGGVFVPRDATVTMVNCVIDQNEAWHEEFPFPPMPGQGSVRVGSGGAIYIDGGNLTMVHCTIVDNYSPIDDGVDTRSSLTVIKTINSIIVDGSFLGPDISHSNIVFTEPGGPGNISEDPLFVNRTNGNYRLLSTSPCIDSGTDAGVPTDLSANPRPVDVLGRGVDGPNAYDMGAYEFQLSPADLNSDGFVRPEDLLLFQEEWHSPVNAGSR